MKESREKYYGTEGNESIDELRKQYEVIIESLSKPIIRLESACFMWLVKNEKELIVDLIEKLIMMSLMT